MTVERKTVNLRVVDNRLADAADVACVGGQVRSRRRELGWTLARLSRESGIPQSTLSKFETDTVSLPIDRLFKVSDSLGLNVSDLFASPPALSESTFAGRRSVARAGGGRLTSTPNYSREWLFPDLMQKRMFPVMQNVRARDMAEFGPLLRHEGEEFSLVFKGRVQVVTEIYEPVTLNEMDGIYIDSRMGHAYLNVSDGESAILNVSTMSGPLPPLETLFADETE